MKRVKTLSSMFKSWTDPAPMASTSASAPAAPDLPSGPVASYLDLSAHPTLGPYYPKATYVLIIDNAFTPSECQQLIDFAESDDQSWEPAFLNMGGNRQELVLEQRNCGRIMKDDHEVADVILNRIKPFLGDVLIIGNRRKNWPGIVGDKGPKGQEWKMTRMNERLRFLKYGPGQYFKAHCDGAFTTDLIERDPNLPEERSFLTFQLYLSSDSNLKGGATTIHSYNMDHEHHVEATQGRVLVFQHRNVLHSGQEVEGGEKIAVRSDIMYTRILD